MLPPQLISFVLPSAEATTKGSLPSHDMAIGQSSIAGEGMISELSDTDEGKVVHFWGEGKQLIVLMTYVRSSLI